MRDAVMPHGVWLRSRSLPIFSISNKYYKFAINVQHHSNCIGCIAKYSREDLSSDELHQMNVSLVTIFANFSHSS